LILVSNDDGVQAKGIAALIEIVKDFGEVVVVAPEEPHSGMSHAITMNSPLRLHCLKKEENLTIYSCSGTPVDCIKLALNQILDRKPDFIVSGINHGSNASISVIYSGTMAAAIEGCLNGIPSMGFSVLDHSRNADFTIAKHIGKKIFEKVLASGLLPGTCLNINFPVIAMDQVKGMKVCRQADGVWKEEFEKRIDPNGRDYFWLTGSFNNFEPLAEDTDEWALANNYISIVPIQIDLTSYQVINQLKKQGFESN